MHTIRNEARGTTLAAAAREVTSPWTRFWGLMGRASLPAGDALVFPGVKAVHTHFVRFPIDVVFYDETGVVIDVAHELRPWRFSPYRPKAAGVIELPAGTARSAKTQSGDLLSFQ